MAITGKFLADFSSFNAEVQKAQAQLGGLEAQATGAAAAADRIGASSSVATTGVTGLATATTGLTTSQNLATLSTAELDAMIAGETVAMSTAAAATEAAAVSAGAYGSVLFATAEAEVAATTATTGFTASLATAATTITGLIATIAPWLAALGIAVAYLKEYIEAQGKAAVAAETAAAKQDVINKAISQGAPAGISYANAIKYVNEQEAHRIAMNPGAAADAYIAKLTAQGKAAIRTAGEEAALTEGLAARGIVLGTTIDLEKEMTEGIKKQTKATEEARAAQERWNKSIQDATIHLNLSVFTLNRYGAVTLPNVESSLKGVETETNNLANHSLPTLGISIYDIGQKGIKSFGDLRTTAQRFDEEIQRIGRDLPMMVADAIHGGDWTRGLEDIGREIGERLGFAIAGPLGAAIGSFLPEIGQGIADFFGKILPGEGPWAKTRREIEEAIKKAKEFKQAQDDALDLLKEASAKYGPSQPELEATEKHLHELFDAMVKAGTYSAEQLDAAYYAWQKAMADAGNEAAKAWVKAHDAATAGAKAANAEMQKLIDRRDELTKGISQEAPEAEMGVIEKQMRAERDAIEQQIKDAQAAADAAADAQSDAAEITKERWGDASDVLKDEMSSAADDAAGHIKDAFDFTIHIPIAFDVPGIPVVPMESGGSGRVTKPTLFYSKGNEDFAFSGEGRSFSGRSGPMGGISVGEIHVYANGADLQDMKAFAPKFIEALRVDTGGMRSAIERVS